MIIPFVLICEGHRCALDDTRLASSQTASAGPACAKTQRGRRAGIVWLPEFALPSVPCMARFSQIDPQAPREKYPTMSVPIVERLRTEWRRPRLRGLPRDGGSHAEPVCNFDRARCAGRPDAQSSDHSRNIAGTTSFVQLLRRQAIVNGRTGDGIITSSDLEP